MYFRYLSHLAQVEGKLGLRLSYAVSELWRVSWVDEWRGGVPSASMYSQNCIFLPFSSNISTPNREARSTNLRLRSNAHNVIEEDLVTN